MMDEYRSRQLAAMREHVRERIPLLQRQGFESAEWSSAGDEHTCVQCRSRDGKRFTFEQLYALMQTEFCVPGDPDDCCRCCLVA